MADIRILNSQLSELPDTSKNIIRLGEGYNIWIFNGPMGVGKTTLIKEICKQKGVIDNVTSPTYSIVNEYLTSENQTIFHFDFFRIKHETEALDIGTDEYLVSGNLCLIEWVEKIPSLIPQKRMELFIEVLNDNNRKIYVSHVG
ncbi:MAG: tRNA (adenosine(37)-N6)-threonylcarbamoyltransferase complex ATPase subunit type 1 TsaE [Bacteroidota bacterium]|nr:tRNA (adenosine(37)-N6)-threonylcarbamoyltransferase complex ATPase subunit type 1 TsaE [Bacteroidota bacterium]